MKSHCILVNLQSLLLVKLQIPTFILVAILYVVFKIGNYVASLILHANIAEVTLQELSLSCLILCVLFYFIRRRLNKIIN